MENLGAALFTNLDLLQKGFIGVGLQHISKEYIHDIKIPIPSLKCQQELVRHLDFIYEKSNKTSLEKMTELNHLNTICLEMQQLYGINELKTIEQVCNIQYGTRIIKKDNISGEYPVYGSGRPMFSTNTFNREGYNILVGRFALSSECVRFVNEPIFLNDSGFSIIPKEDTLLHMNVLVELHRKI